jgi:8-oxo-dGTP pyrophosphatase MutT (NUDIX family)
MIDLSVQKYKIWANTAWLVLLSPKEFRSLPLSQYPLLLILNEPALKKVNEYMSRLMNGDVKCPVLVVTRNPKKRWTQLIDSAKMVYAAGGVVQRSDGKYLFIYRRGWWDLPKGKLDKGESNRQAAVREVLEEVGLSCKIIHTLPYTYHCYHDRNKIVIKQTAWYRMLAKSDKIKLQKEEDITKSTWVPQNKLKGMHHKVYPNLQSLLRI